MDKVAELLFKNNGGLWGLHTLAILLINQDSCRIVAEKGMSLRGLSNLIIGKIRDL